MAANGNPLTDHLDLWTSALLTKSTAGRGSNGKQEAYGIKKLRELILELAVRGKLVPQDPNEEPASVLLKKIAAEKQRLTSNGDIRTAQGLPEVNATEMPYELPEGWLWTRVGDAGLGSTGKTPSTGNPEYYGGEVPFIGPGQIAPTGELLDSDKTLTADGRIFSTVAEPGDILMVCIGGSIGKSAIVSSEVTFNQQINCLRPLFISSEYLKYSMSTPSFQSAVLTNATGSATPIINRSKWEELHLPLPPLAEQHRIVAKVDELMALCDRLEQRQADSQEVHQTLVENLLGTLTRVASPEELSEAWSRIADHFDTLFTTEHSIDQLKQTILQLAVMGKLVPQDPNDEPAHVLLQRIAKRKEQMIEQGALKNDKPSAGVRDGEPPFPLPEGWAWSRLPGIGELARGKSKHRPRNDPKLYSDGAIPMVQTGDVSRANLFIKTHTALYNDVGLSQSRLWPKGTMCITIAANIAETGILAFDACFPDSIVGLIPLDEGLDVKYFEYFMRTAKSHLEDFAPSTAQKNINLDILAQLQVPVPPAKELVRIVAKVDELMALCDTLKARLKAAQTTQIHLTDAIVEQAVA